MSEFNYNDWWKESGEMMSDKHSSMEEALKGATSSELITIIIRLKKEADGLSGAICRIDPWFNYESFEFSEHIKKAGREARREESIRQGWTKE